MKHSLVVVVGVGVVQLGLGAALLVHEDDGAQHEHLGADAEEGPQRRVHVLDAQHGVVGQPVAGAARVRAGVAPLGGVQHEGRVLHALLVGLQLEAAGLGAGDVQRLVAAVRLVRPRHRGVRLAHHLETPHQTR